MKTTEIGVVLLALALFTSAGGGLQPANAQTFYIQSQSGVPFPYDPYDGAEPVVTLDASKQIYRVQDNTNDWDMLMTAKELDARSALSSMAMDSPPDPTTDTNSSSGGDGGTNSYTGTVSYSTNDLWLQIVSVTNRTANLVIHPPWNVTNGVYDLHYCTNLTSPVAWKWLLRTQPGQTNLIVHNVTDMQGFYRLGSPNDIIANDSLGTNFWVAFFNMLNNGPNISLYISSPLGATGTVTFPAVLTNGPVVFVTNCGDVGLNGTYVLTNLTAQEQTDWPNNGLDTMDVGYVNGTNWIDFSEGGRAVWLFAYDSNLDVCTFLYSTTSVDFNGSDTNWYNWYYDTNLPPTTECPQVSANPSIAFTLPAGAVTNIQFGPGLMMTDYDMVETNGIHITTSEPVAVYGAEYSVYSSASFTVYPTPLLGTNYCLMARATMDPSYQNQYSEFGIVATEDNTTVTTMPSGTANLAGYTNPIVLQQGETYQVHSIYTLNSISETNDVTGTLVTSDKPVGVFAGADIAFVPDENFSSADPLMQEQLPVEDWGTQALSMGFAGQTNGDSYRVLAAYDDTTLTVTGAVVTIVSDGNIPLGPPTVTITNETVTTNLMAGQFYDIIVDGPVEFQGSQPIQVAHFMNGGSFNSGENDEGDPCEILLPPTGYYLLTNIVYRLPGGFDDSYLNVIVAQSALTNTSVDGSILAATNFVAIGTSGYCGARIPMTTSGTHTVISSQPVGVEVYGFGLADAYGYFGGVVKGQSTR